MKKSKASSDAISIIHKRYYRNRLRRLADLDKARTADTIGRKIQSLRTASGLSQRQLAKLVGTTASVICRLEDADYEGHTLSMLHRIAKALHSRVEISLIPLKDRRAA